MPSFTSESVTEGHPDKVADAISDAVLDAYLAEDPAARVACETLVTRDLVVIAGEVTSEAVVDVEAVARQKIRDIGYVDTLGFAWDSAEVVIRLGLQSPDIARGLREPFEARIHPLSDCRVQRVHHFDRLGAGDQGMVFGYAADETPEPIMLAHALTRRLAECRRSGLIPYLAPDGKAQVTVRYEADERGRSRPVDVERVLISTQHEAGVSQRQLWGDLLVHVVAGVVLPHLANPERLKEPGFLVVNPAGPFVHGGPVADTGLTGRKIVVDSYGGACRHGGGAFSGKDPTKVDRSGAYAARQAAKAVVASGLASECELTVAYAIGSARPWSVSVDCFGTAQAEEEWVARWVQQRFDLRPQAILERLDLCRPIYASTASYGHFGRVGLPWEEV